MKISSSTNQEKKQQMVYFISTVLSAVNEKKNVKGLLVNTALSPFFAALTRVAVLNFASPSCLFSVVIHPSSSSFDARARPSPLDPDPEAPLTPEDSFVGLPPISKRRKSRRKKKERREEKEDCVVVLGKLELKQTKPWKLIEKN